MRGSRPVAGIHGATTWGTLMPLHPDLGTDCSAPGPDADRGGGNTAASFGVMDLTHLPPGILTGVGLVGR